MLKGYYLNQQNGIWGINSEVFSPNPKNAIKTKGGSKKLFNDDIKNDDNKIKTIFYDVVSKNLYMENIWFNCVLPCEKL